MKVRAIKSFNDLEANTHRNVDDVFEVSKERAKFLLEHNAIEIIEEPKVETVEEEVIEEPIAEENEEVEKKENIKKKGNKK